MYEISIDKITLQNTSVVVFRQFAFRITPFHVYSFPNKAWFLRVNRTSLVKTLWKEEKLLVTSNFSFSHSVFYPFGELSAIFIKFKIVVCTLLQFGAPPGWLSGERVRLMTWWL